MSELTDVGAGYVNNGGERCTAVTSQHGTVLRCDLLSGHAGKHHTMTSGPDLLWSTLYEAPHFDAIDHPTHYGGADNPYEAIKVIEAWHLGFCLGNAVKYICRAGKKPVHMIAGGERPPESQWEKDKVGVEDLKKARWYLDREITRLEKT